ncbi:hypothetical protein Bca52824_037522 [Brassica carinata]|uniref:Uncharacterized protein n=1 Tax=Brassica carinata TaxID=52824 RepID=A0A8X7RPG7_BRACI|nr:hypothetical protein Bca52824_037522 [Brassica carinata]
MNERDRGEESREISDVVSGAVDFIVVSLAVDHPDECLIVGIDLDRGDVKKNCRLPAVCINIIKYTLRPNSTWFHHAQIKSVHPYPWFALASAAMAKDGSVIPINHLLRIFEPEPDTSQTISKTTAEL